MAEIKAVAHPIPDPKIGKPKPKSGVSFPYYDLAKSVEVARIIHSDAGGACDRAQLAPLLKYSGVKNGGFLSRVAAAKMFGFIEQHDEKLRVTRRGQAAVAPISDGDADRAKYDAFLAVDLFKKVFEKFSGQSLPGEAGLTNLLLNEYRVVPDRVPPTLKIMLDSADSAGFFKANDGKRTRMVAPILGVSASQDALPAALNTTVGNRAGTTQHRNVNGGGGSGGGDPPQIPAAILGLLTNLPPAGTTMSAKKREALVSAFSGAVGYIYPDADD